MQDGVLKVQLHIRIIETKLEMEVYGYCCKRILHFNHLCEKTRCLEDNMYLTFDTPYY